MLASSLLCLVPSVLCDRAGDLPNVDEIINTYKDDLPYILFPISFRYSSKPKEDRPNTAAKALKECDDDLFPNIYALLKTCATIPATSCECERSASSLRRLHTYNRACMGQERLSSLALMHIHYQVKIVLDEVVNLYHFGRCLSPVSLAQVTFCASSPIGCAPKSKPDSPLPLPIKRLQCRL